MMGLAQMIWMQTMDTIGVPSDGKYRYLCGCSACKVYRALVYTCSLQIRPAEQHSGEQKP